MRRRLLLIGLVFVLLAGCVPESEHPKQALAGALSALRRAEGLQVTVKVITTIESLQALAREGGIELEGEKAEKIVDSWLTLSIDDAAPDPGSSLSANISGEPAAMELRAIANSLFLRAHLPVLVETLPHGLFLVERLGEQAATSGVSVIKAVMRGRWVEIGGLRRHGRGEVVQRVGGEASLGTRGPGRGLLDLFEDVVNDAPVREARVLEGVEEGPGKHLVAMIPFRDVYRRVRGLLANASPSLSTSALPRLAASALPHPSRVPKEVVPIDLWVKDAFLRQVHLDFLDVDKLKEEVLPKGVTRLRLRLTFDEFRGQVEEPEDFVKVNLTPENFGRFWPALRSSR